MVDKEIRDDEELGTVVDQKISESIGWYSSKLSAERENVMRYYNGEFPKRTSPAGSSFVSTDVYDGIESMKAQLLETFAAGNRIIAFDPLTAADVLDARIASAYTDHVIFRQNDAFRIFEDVIDDALKARVGVAKVYWEESVDFEDHTFEDIDESEVQALASNEDVDSLDAVETAINSGRFSGKVAYKVDKSQVRIEVVNPEEFCVEPQAKGLTNETFCVTRPSRPSMT